MTTDRYRCQLRLHATAIIVFFIFPALSGNTVYSASNRLKVIVDSLTDSPSATACPYILMPGVEGVKATDLQFKEFARYVQKALASRGYVYTDDPTQAEVAIILNYGIGESQITTHEFSYPIIPLLFDETGTSSTTMRGYLILTAIDIHAFTVRQESVELWRTTATTLEGDGDLRRVFPVLVVAAQPHIGTNTGHQVTVQVAEDGERVRAIKSPDPPIAGTADAEKGSGWWED